MSVSIKTEPRLVRAAGSHWLELDRYARSEFGPFTREELYPVLELEVPRAGLVHVQMKCDRYVHSSGWSEWRVYAGDVREARDDVAAFNGPHAAGIGESTRAAINEVCRPVVLEWLGSDEYRAARLRSAVRAVVREIDAPAAYKTDDVRRTVEALEVAGELGSHEAIALREAVARLEEARAAVDDLTAGLEEVSA